MVNEYIRYIFIVIFLFSIFRISKERFYNLFKNRIFISLIFFYFYYLFNYDFFNSFNVTDAYHLRSIEAELVGLIIFFISFILILNQTENSSLTNILFFYIFITFVLHLFFHFIDYNSIYNKNFYSYHSLILLVVSHIVFKSKFKTLIFIWLFLFLINYFSFFSRTTSIGFVVYLVVFILSDKILSSRLTLNLTIVTFFFLITSLILYYTFYAFENEFFLSLDQDGIESGSKGVFGRLYIWVQLIDEISNNLFFGLGSNISSEYFYSDQISRNLSSHNTYLDILFRGGIIGLIVFLNVIYQKFNYFYENKESIYSKIGISFIFSVLFLSTAYEIIFFTILTINLFYWSIISILINKINSSN